MNQQKPRKEKPFNSYARFSGIVFQMIAIIVAGTFIGIKLDEHFPNENNLFTIILAFTAVIISVIFVIRSINAASK
ncbi:AtpZ/AtpI family protein [Maribacter sp. 2304DJ31-5]|uniref:AtpZ/AtpI family protein n=1 Tax=Maribacter sp. 2304DJ31-5 TaxID=3386273 RepID=UPI0039BD623E